MVYQGRIDDVENPAKKPNNLDARNAIEALINGKVIETTSTKVFGCSVKWAEKKEIVQKVYDKWASEPVNVDMIDEAGLKDLLKNNIGQTSIDQCVGNLVWTLRCRISGIHYN